MAEQEITELDLEEKAKACWTEAFHETYKLVKEDGSSMSFNCLMDKMFMVAYHNRLRMARFLLERNNVSASGQQITTTATCNEQGSVCSYGCDSNQSQLPTSLLSQRAPSPSLLSDSDTGSESEFVTYTPRSGTCVSWDFRHSPSPEKINSNDD